MRRCLSSTCCACAALFLSMAGRPDAAGKSEGRDYSAPREPTNAVGALRHQYRPPEYHVCRLTADTPGGWADIPRVPLLSDPYGESIASHETTIQIAYDETHLYLQAECRDDVIVQDAEQAPGDPGFRKQDCIELAFYAPPQEKREYTLLAFTPDGRWTDNGDLHKDQDSIRLKTSVDGANWSLAARIPFDVLGMDSPSAGDRLRCHVARLRHGDGWRQFSSNDATILHDSMTWRYGRFVFDKAPEDRPRLDHVAFPEGNLREGVNFAHITLLNASDQVVRGRLQVTRPAHPRSRESALPDTRRPPSPSEEEAPDGLRRSTQKTPNDRSGASEALAYNCELPPGRTTIRVPFHLERPTYTNFRFSLAADEGGVSAAQTLGSICLRAAPPQVSTEALALKHPYLHFTKPTLETLRQKAENPAFRHWLAALRGWQKNLAPPSLVQRENAPSGSKQALKLSKNVKQCLGRWIIDRDPRLIELATRYIGVMERDLDFDDVMDLQEGNASAGLALAYDTFHPHLSEDERKTWRSVLERFLALYLKTARERHWNTTATPNVNPVVNGGGGFVALALLDEHPDAPEALWFVRRNLWTYLDYTYGEDGGCTEGMQYWSYGGTNFVRIVTALERVLGTDDGFFESPRFRNWPNNIRVSLSNDGKMHGMNDTIPVPLGGEIACFLAARFNDPVSLWWSTKSEDIRQDMLARGKRCPYKTDPLYAFLFRPNLPLAEQQPPLPTVLTLRGIQYAIMRSGADYDSTLVAGIKGNRPPHTHHKQPDTGAYYIHVRGERLLIDPGYYNSGMTQHSMPIIDGVEHKNQRYWQAFAEGEIVASESAGDIRYLACDSTPFYRGQAHRVVRHLVMVGDEAVVLLDDIVPVDPEATVRAQYHTGGGVNHMDEGRAFTIAGNHAKLRLELLTRSDLRLEPQPEIDMDSLRWGYTFAECRWIPVWGEYVPKELDPLVTVFRDVTDDETTPSRVIRRRGRLIVVLPTGRRVQFTYDNKRWTMPIKEQK